MKTWKKLGSAKYDGTCCLCSGRIRARKDSIVHAGPGLTAHEHCHDHAIEHRAGMVWNAPSYISDVERERVAAGRPVWAQRLAEIEGEAAA